MWQLNVWCVCEWRSVWRCILEKYYGPLVVQDSLVDITTRYGRDGPRIEIQWGIETSRTRPDLSWSPFRLLYNGYQVAFLRVKRSGRGVDHPPHLPLRLNKEYSCTFVPSLSLHGLFQGEISLDFITQLLGLRCRPARDSVAGSKEIGAYS